MNELHDPAGRDSLRFRNLFLNVIFYAQPIKGPHNPVRNAHIAIRNGDTHLESETSLSAWCLTKYHEGDTPLTVSYSSKPVHICRKADFLLIVCIHSSVP